MEHFYIYYFISTLLITGLVFFFKKRKQVTKTKKIPISVSYHFSRKCNYECGFCFHTAKTSHVMNLELAKKGLFKLKEAGMKKINFAGGEPFLYPDFLGQLVKYSKETLKLESVSIISNGSLIKENWFKKYSAYLDILAISCDSTVEEVNVKIGRGSGQHIEKLIQVRKMCYEYNIKFKLNTVVCKYNYNEDMNEFIARLEPFRWKCFQVLIVKTENDGNDTIKNANKFTITDEEYEIFVRNHESQPSFIKEPNSIMKSSYLIIDEYMRFLDKGDKDQYIISESILDVDVFEALSQINWDTDSFIVIRNIFF